MEKPKSKKLYTELEFYFWVRAFDCEDYERERVSFHHITSSFYSKAELS